MRISLILIVVLLVSCEQSHSTTKLHFEKDLIPEGIAIDTVSEIIYLNSLYKNKIVSSHLDGSDPEDFIQEGEFGYLPGFGMTIKGDTLFALGNSHDTSHNQSILLLLDISSGQLIKRYFLKSIEKTYLNDIAVDGNGKFFISDSKGSDIYSQNHETGQLEVYFSDESIIHTNGIAISEDDRYLYLATMGSGLRVLDLFSKKLVNRPNEFKGIDGLKFYKNTLIAIANGRRDIEKNGVFQYHLTKEGSEIVATSKLMAFEKPTDIPTTFAINNGYMYFVTDSQMDLLDENSNIIIDTTKLEAYRLFRKKL